MSPSDISCDVVVVGAGVLGMATAAELGARGLSVRVVDPGGDSASSVAAGMIAPAMESVIEEVDADRAALLRRAAALWPDFARRFGIDLHDDASEWRGADQDGFLKRLQTLGFNGRIEGASVTLEGERRVSPAQALAALAAAPGVRTVSARAEAANRHDGGWRVDTSVAEIFSPHLVIATGAALPIEGLPREVRDVVAAIIPVRGQMLHVPGAQVRIIRDEEAYAAPLGAGLAVGATMEAGLRHLDPDPETASAHRRWARDRLNLDGEGGVARVGVRGATQDGLPLAGPVGEGLHLALAPRRNGWLLAPLVATVVSGGLIYRRTSEPAFDPFRSLAP